MRNLKMTSTFFVQTNDQELKNFLSEKGIIYSTDSSNMIGVEADSEAHLFELVKEYRNLKPN